MSDNYRLSAETIARYQAERAEWLKRGGFERDAIERAERLKAKEEAEWRERVLEVRLGVEAILEEEGGETLLRRVLIKRARGRLPKPSQAPGPSNAPQPSKAAKNFAVLVEVVEQVCKSKKIEPHATEPCAKRIKNAVDAILRAKQMRPAGIGRLKRALGGVRASGQNKCGSGFLGL